MNIFIKKTMAIILGVLTVISFSTVGASASDADSNIDRSSFDMVEGSGSVKQQESVPAIEVSKDPRAVVINAATLEPASPKSEELDVYLDKLMVNIITDDMTTYQKTKSCYDYITSNTKYGSHMANLSAPIESTTAGAIYNKYGAVEGFGAVALSAKTGRCNAYASAFILMANEIGLNAYLVKGSTRGSGGGYVYHEWAEVNMDGTVYVFDPQLDQNLSGYGLGEYNMFCKTYEQTNGRYSKA